MDYYYVQLEHLITALLYLTVENLVMDNTKLTLADLKFFHAIDMLLYILLVKDLARNPYESLQIMGIWLWLERGFFNMISKGENRLNFCNIISKIFNLPPFLINEIADEAVLCLKCINNQFPSPFSPEAAIIPLTHNLMKNDISLQFFLENSYVIFHEVQRLISDIYIPMLSDIMETARHGGFNPSPEQSPSGPTQSPDDSLSRSLSSLSIGGETSQARARAHENEASRPNRTMFVTFSKGYPVTEDEVRGFFTRIFGDCIESFYMHEVGDDEQALYAVVVFERLSIIQIILDGESKAKFSINGKHVWMRQFVPRGGRGILPCGCFSVGPSTCPHHQ
ncbi:hypothetical protein BUALT_Bualt16G0042600 [Buddleja alternifolia]|uniref:RRM domain-containing protein n=1 Tax=Buddleja alternifolia TaxID=168488 RepID=A0AAV6WAR6_9LAMI|nr:hypothetical protein BUALT_Bualt16G0042600 [Buddleja alternifolia]